MDTVDELLLREGLALEELLHELVGGLGNSLGNSGNKSLDTVLELLAYLSCRHIGLDSIALAVVLVSLHLDEVDVGDYLSAADNGNNYGANRRSENGLEVSEDVEEVSVLVVYLCYDEHLGLALLYSLVVSLSCAYLYARLCGYCDEHRVSRTHALGHLGSKVEQTGSIKQVYLMVVIFKSSKRCADRNNSLYLFGVIVADSGTVGSLAEAVCSACLVQQSLCERCLTGAVVSGECDISYFGYIIVFHLGFLLRFGKMQAAFYAACNICSLYNHKNNYISNVNKLQYFHNFFYISHHFLCQSLYI